MGAGNEKGLAELTANPLSLRWLRGLDLNQRPLGYEPIDAHRGLQHATTSPKRKREVSILDLGSGSRTLEADDIRAAGVIRTIAFEPARDGWTFDVRLAEPDRA